MYAIHIHIQYPFASLQFQQFVWQLSFTSISSNFSYIPWHVYVRVPFCTLQQLVLYNLFAIIRYLNEHCLCITRKRNSIELLDFEAIALWRVSRWKCTNSGKDRSYRLLYLPALTRLIPNCCFLIPFPEFHFRYSGILHTHKCKSENDAVWNFA